MESGQVYEVRQRDGSSGWAYRSGVHSRIRTRGDHLHSFAQVDSECGKLGDSIENDENFSFGRLGQTRTLEDRRPAPLAIVDIGARAGLQGKPLEDAIMSLRCAWISPLV